MDNDYLHSILRDSIYFLLRLIEKKSKTKYEEIYQEELNDKILNLISLFIYQLCLKGLDFNLQIFLHYIPDIIINLINYEDFLTRERIQKTLIHIYQSIKLNNQSKFCLLAYAIQKL